MRQRGRESCPTTEAVRPMVERLMTARGTKPERGGVMRQRGRESCPTTEAVRPMVER